MGVRMSYEDMAKAFGLGSDARLVGQSVDKNPFYHNSELREQWESGWLDAQYHWGEEVRNRWQYKRLPLVRS
jgi:ribosome modulation factor